MGNLRIDVLAEVVGPLVLQPHAVEHARSRFGHARIVVALARLERGAFHDDGSYFFQRHEILKLQPIAEGAASRHHGIGQPQLIYLYT